MLQEEGEFLGEIREIIDKRLYILRDDFKTTVAENGEQFEIKFLNEAKKESFEPVNEIPVIADKEDMIPRFTSGSWDIVKIGTHDISIEDDSEEDREGQVEGEQNASDEEDENEHETEGEESDGGCAEAETHAPSSHIGSYIFADGDMVFVDKSNRVVKLVNSKFEVIDYITLRAEPTDFTFIGNGEFAIALNNTVAVYYIHENDSKIRFRSLYKTVKTIKALCMLGDNFLILSDVVEDGTPKTAAEEFNRQFKFLREIDNINGSCVGSRNSDDIVVGDSDYVRIKDKNGQEKWWFMRGYMKKVINVSFDTQDNIYICDREDNAVTVVSPSNYLNSRAIIPSLPKPACVSVNPIKRTIVVGCIGDNNVHVYKFVRSVNPLYC